MTGWIVDAVSCLFLAAGSLFYVIGAVGIWRMPDVFTRMHAASVSETLGVGFLIAGMMVQGGLTLVTLKLAIIVVALFYTGPVATHALARAARYAGLKPLLHKGRKTGRKTGRQPAKARGAAASKR